MRTTIALVTAAAVLTLGTTAQAFPPKGGKGGHPAGIAKKGGFPPGLAKKGGVPPGLVNKGGLPPGLAKKQGPQGWTPWQNNGPWGQGATDLYAPGTYQPDGYPPTAYPFQYGPGYSGYAQPWSQAYPNGYGYPVYGTSGQYFAPPYSGYSPPGYGWQP